MNFGKRIRTMLFWLTFILTFITVIFIRSVGDNMGETIKMIGSVIALFTIPFIVLFNWFIGITLFFAYPFIIIMLRFVRYFYENLISINITHETDGSTKVTPGNKRVLGFENRLSASWSLIFGTLIQSVYNISNIRKEATSMNSKGDFNKTISNTPRGSESKLYDFTSNKQFTSPIMNLMLSFINKDSTPEDQTNFYKNLITIIITMIIWMICYFGIARANLN